MREMSGDDAETLIRFFYDAFNRKDFDAAKAVIHEDIVVEETPGFNPVAGVYRGPHEARRYFEGWFRFWKTVNVEVLSIVAGSQDRVATRVRVTVVGRNSDLDVTDDWGHVFEVRDGKLFRATLYRTPEEALEAAGRS